MNTTDDDAFARTLRQAAWTWLALLALMFASLGSAWLNLGRWNMVAGLAIAAIKASLVLWVFMRLREATGLIRLVGLVALVGWAVLAAMSRLDSETRSAPAAAVQPAQVQPPLRGPAKAP
jgi:cytochrome c oxidase subunit 4